MDIYFSPEIILLLDFHTCYVSSSIKFSPVYLASQLVSLSKDRQAWTDSNRNKRVDPNAEKPFQLDWSDDEDDLQPMEIDFDTSKFS